MLDDRLVLCVLRVRTVGDDDATNLKRKIKLGFLNTRDVRT